MTELHVIPDAWGTWRVYEANATVALSEHTNATEAKLAAWARAEDRDAVRVVVHDRYHRTRDDDDDVSSAALRARARHARARQLRARQLAGARDRAQQLNRPF